MASLLAALGLALAAGSAWGYGYTDINAPPGGELSHLEILETVYGGTWTADANGRDFSNGVIDVTRVFDFNGGDEFIHVLDGSPDNVDQVWTDGTVTVTAEAKYADFYQSFGWNGGGAIGINYEVLLTENDIGQGSKTIEISGDFLWGIRPTDGPWKDYLWWSKQSENESPYYGKDHMVTYFVEGLGGVDETVWLLFWEDYPCGGDEDFNDFVIEVRAVATVPEPSTGLLVAAGLLAVGLLRRRRALS